MNSKTLLAVLSLAALVQACTSKVEDVNNRVDNASFELGQIEMVAAEVRATDGEWPDLKNKALVSLRTCITDIAYLEKIAGERFAIKTPTHDSVRMTNAQGCVNWTETVDFNYLEDEKYIRVKGSIAAAGNFKGTREFNLAINPWREQAVDLSFGRVESTASALTAEDIEKGNRIAITNASLGIIKHKFHAQQTELELEVVTSPMLVRRNLTGALVRERFNGGVFDVSYYLVTKNVSDNSRNVISQVDKVVKVGTDGTLTERVNFLIHEGIDPKDVIEVALKLTAKNAPFDLGTTEGLLPIRQLEGTTSSELIEIPESIAHILNRPKPFTQREASADDFGFIIDSVTVAPGAEGGANMSGTSDRRIVDSSFNVCLVDSLIKDSVRNYPFSIELQDEDGTSLFNKVVTTELRSGCALFRASLPYRRYDAPRWKKYKLTVSSTREPFEDIKKSRTVSINPWIRTGDFGIDSQVGAPPTVTMTTAPKIHIPGVSYNFLGHAQTGVRINKGLDLLFTRSYMLELQPMVYMNHRFEGDSAGQEPLMTGNYKVRVLILAPKPGINVDYTSEINLADYHTLTAAEKNVAADAGFLRTRVDLPLVMTDLIPFSFKNVILVQVTPVDGSALQAGYFVGVFNGSRRQDTVGSSLESKRDLSTRNLNISRTLISRIAAVKNKLAKDSVIPNNKANFISTLQAEAKGSVPTINHTTYAVQRTNVSMATYDSEAAFKTGQGLLSPTPAISNLINDPSRINAQLIDDVCHALYNRNLVTKQTTIPSGGFGISMPIDTSITGFEHKRCKANFRAHVDLQRVHHIATITAQPTALQTEGGSMTRSQGVWFSESNTFNRATGGRESNFFQHGWSAHAGLGFAKIVSLGADYSASGGFRQETYAMDNNDRALGQFKRADNSVSQRYNFDRFRVSYRARAIRCLMITPKLVKSEIPAKTLSPTIIDAFRTQPPKLHEVTSAKRLYVCKSTTDEQVYNESYYFVKNGETGTLADVDAAQGQTVTLIRGDKTFNRYRSDIIESDRAMVIVQTKDDSLAQRFEHHMQNNGSGIDFKKRLDYTFPGLIEF